MLAKSGINHSTHMIDVSDEALEAYVKIDTNTKHMRFKSWPFYQDWCEIFGKDRATEDGAEGLIEALNNMLNEDTQQTTVEDEGVFDGFDFFADGIGETAERVSHRCSLKLNHIRQVLVVRGNLRRIGRSLKLNRRFVACWTNSVRGQPLV